MMKTQSRNLASWALRITSVLGVLCLGGCSQETYGDLGHVTGTVTLDGKPSPNVQVTFAPQDGRPSMGVTDESGRYELIYIRATKGAVPGEHSVSIASIPPEQDPGAKVPVFKDPIPPRYNLRSELKEVVVKGPNTIDFQLKSK
ncbi:carboxypeptidase regulatory-like domain-containing protein [bacterium]|nr:carboxypeptidase regulatory-like domain-containing protein [bacterium]